MPQLGLGVWQVSDDQAETVVDRALQAGYRSIDTAFAYQNERGVGRAVAAAALPRDDLFITTKLQNSDHGHDAALRAFDVSLERLGLDYVDLYLIHWPVPSRDQYVDTWRVLESLYADKRVKAVGVSNFQPAHLDRLRDECDVVPAVNQIELHPRLTQQTLREYHRAHGVATEAWSPLGQGGDLLGDPQLASVAAKHDKTVAQIVLRWHIQLGNVVIPKTVTPSRIDENIDVFDFTLDAADMRTIAALNTDTRLGPDPDTFG
ncbi:MAG: aldo/keto reductase [Stackebrandtia sp.]